MTKAQHRAIHNDLHRAFDALMTDFLSQNASAYPSTTTLRELMEWSSAQTQEPTLPAGSVHDEDLQEGMDCPIADCSGRLGFHPPENCSCHLHPPCDACVNNPLVCLVCGWQYEDNPQ